MSIIEERIEKTKHRIIKIIKDLENAASKLLYQNKQARDMLKQSGKEQSELAASLKTLQADNARLKRKLQELEVSIKEKKLLNLAPPSNSNVSEETADERLTGQDTSEYIDISINQLKSLLKRKNNL